MEKTLLTKKTTPEEAAFEFIKDRFFDKLRRNRAHKNNRFSAALGLSKEFLEFYNTNHMKVGMELSEINEKDRTIAKCMEYANTFEEFIFIFTDFTMSVNEARRETVSVMGPFPGDMSKMPKELHIMLEKLLRDLDRSMREDEDD